MAQVIVEKTEDKYTAKGSYSVSGKGTLNFTRTLNADGTTVTDVYFTGPDGQQFGLQKNGDTIGFVESGLSLDFRDTFRAFPYLRQIDDQLAVFDKKPGTYTIDDQVLAEYINFLAPRLQKPGYEERGYTETASNRFPVSGADQEQAGIVLAGVKKFASEKTV